MNFLEQLTVEWFTYNRFFVTSNLKFGPLGHGGYEGEVDILAFNPKDKVLYHIETSMDALSWGKRKDRMSKKFADAEKYYKDLFPSEFSEIRKMVIVSWGKPKDRFALGEDIELQSISEFVEEIARKLSNEHPMKRAVPENLPLLRAIQFTASVMPTNK